MEFGAFVPDISWCQVFKKIYFKWQYYIKVSESNMYDHDRYGNSLVKNHRGPLFQPWICFTG